LTLLKATMEKAREVLSPYTGGGNGESGEIHSQHGQVSGQGGAGVPGPFVPQGPIANRQQALAALDAVIEYYRQTEPSSPVPLMLMRAKKLAKLNFYQILGDLTPDAIDRLKIIVGDNVEGEAPAIGESDSIK
jgi:type VI secretion system protein ImpA